MAKKVGSMEIPFKIDIGQIKRALATVQSGFRLTEKEAKKVQSDFVRLKNITGDFVGKLQLLAGVSAGGFMALAKDSPALAGAFASIGISVQKMAFAFGEGAQKYIDPFATQLERLANWANNNEDTFANIVLGLAIGPTVIAGFVAAEKFLGFITGSTIISGLVSLTPVLLAGAAAFTALALAFNFWRGMEQGITDLQANATGDLGIKTHLLGQVTGHAPAGAEAKTIDAALSSAEGLPLDQLLNLLGFSINEIPKRDIIISYGDIDTW